MSENVNVSTVVWDLERVLRHLCRAVDEKGAQWVDPNTVEYGCMYFTYNERTGDVDGPSCIVGHALSYEEELELAETLLQAGANEDSVDNLTSWLDDQLSTTQAAKVLLAWVQDAQDQGSSWGAALAFGLEKLQEWLDTPEVAEEHDRQEWERAVAALLAVDAEEAK